MLRVLLSASLQKKKEKAHSGISEKCQIAQGR